MIERWRRAVTAVLLVGRALGTLFGICVTVFLLTEVLPGNAATVLAGTRADAERVAALEARAGLNAGLWERFWQWCGGLVTGDFGRSLIDGRSVGELLVDRMAATLWIAAPAWLLAVVGGTVIALSLAWHAGSRAERVGSGLVAAVCGFPEVVLVTLLVVGLAITLDLLPAVSLIPVGGTPADRPEILVLPVLAIALPAMAWCGRLLRGPAVDALRRPFVTDALLRGVAPWRVTVRHGLRHLAAPLAQIATVMAAATLANTAVVEMLLAYQGLGQLLAGSIASRDVPVVQGVAVLLAVFVLVAFMSSDALAAAMARRGGAR
ncbi:ABC transporter permease [Micromonospora sp. WMMD1082]|uniref:ABC transporter permease n=1 Tax=Micromonospora sp. WMMD1082 TaxID=3016104 RepID=UPI0024179E5C|nr:ABC transporter permease [Micromonospora sp. WMMD1082]MDG4795590.1 ABC transporter permease [Micromonospora sp. WMMD1082]